MVSVLKEGSYFGEIALMTNMTRTCTVRAYEFCTLAQMDGETLAIMKEELPSIYSSFYRSLDNYADFEMELRRSFIRNVPYLRQASEKTIS